MLRFSRKGRGVGEGKPSLPVKRGFPLSTSYLPFAGTVHLFFTAGARAEYLNTPALSYSPEPPLLLRLRVPRCQLTGGNCHADAFQTALSDLPVAGDPALTGFVIIAAEK